MTWPTDVTAPNTLYKTMPDPYGLPGLFFTVVIYNIRSDFRCFELYGCVLNIQERDT